MYYVVTLPASICCWLTLEFKGMLEQLSFEIIQKETDDISRNEHHDLY